MTILPCGLDAQALNIGKNGGLASVQNRPQADVRGQVLGSPSDPCAASPKLAADTKRPDGGAIDIWEVGKDVGNVRNSTPELHDCVALS